MFCATILLKYKLAFNTNQSINQSNILLFSYIQVSFMLKAALHVIYDVLMNQFTLNDKGNVINICSLPE